MEVLQKVTTWIMIMLISIIIPTLVTPTLGFDTVKWTLQFGKDSTHYTTTLTSLRDKVKELDKKGKPVAMCGFPVTSKDPVKSKKFILVEIVGSDSRIVTLAFQTSDIYFLGYRDKINNAARANFVADAKLTDEEKRDIFPDVEKKNQINLPYGESYASMEDAAGRSRSSIDLGVQRLDERINKVYGLSYGAKPTKENKKKLAEFGLTVVQMVAEAARFSDIENRVINGGLEKKSFSPDDNMIALEKEWGKISQAIHNASPSCKELKDKLDFPSNVNTVDGLRSYISLLKFKKVKTTRDVARVEL
ncbi:hypothetical protein RND81_03G104500 [Saponaria officinalis]|uniref:rRNA N-glycosylase n=2 Tax=Saponaria officinalis TaxID=3572 RepID=A0AAW1M5E8_SAPOF